MNDEELLQLQAFENDMLRAVADVCEKNNITYYIGCGTLLGAVRHKGFIPWDEDVDVLMPYEDYIRFLEIAQDELGNKFFIQNSNTDKNWNRAYTTIRANNTTMVYEYARGWDIHHGVWLDIFPLAKMKSRLDIRIKKFLLSISNYFLMDNQLSANNRYFMKKFGAIGVFFLRLFYLIPFSARQKLHNWTVKIVAGRKRKYNYIAEIWTSITDYFPKDVFEGKKSTVVFYEREYSTVPNYDKYLRLCYGDYMTPVKDEKNQDFLIVDLNNSYQKYTSVQNRMP